MKVCLKYNKKDFTEDKFGLLKKFIQLLGKKMPLKNDIEIDLLEKRKGRMTTGSYLDKSHRAKVLVKDRLLYDIFRTLSHEWAHAYDRDNLNIKNRKDVGGDSENFANEISGAITKFFMKKHKEQEELFY